MGVEDGPGSWYKHPKSLVELEHFVEDHPRAASIIGTLDINLGLYEGRTWPWVAEEKVSIHLQSFTSLSRHLRVKVLKVTINVPEDEVEDLLARRGKYYTATAVTQLAVTERFELYLGIGPNYDRNVEARYTKQVEDLMMPDSLRNLSAKGFAPTKESPAIIDVSTAFGESSTGFFRPANHDERASCNRDSHAH